MLPESVARRTFLRQMGAGLGLGGIALSQLLPNTGQAASPLASQGTLSPLHFAPKAKRVIFLYMSGGPSHLETFDHKPTLARLNGQSMPESVTKGQPIAQLQGRSQLKVLGPLFNFQKHGENGQEVSEVLPHIANIADDICIIRSMVTEAINHDPAHTFMNTGTAISGRPSMGSWLSYGLGSENDNLPGFVVLTSFGGRNPQPISNRMWHSGFLPGQHQGVLFNSQGAVVQYLDRPAGVTSRRQAEVVESITALDRLRGQEVDDSEIAVRISQYEKAFRMQTSVPELMDFSDESAAAFERYGTKGADGSFAANCLLARRMVERGVRFVQLYHRGWDHHNDLRQFMGVCAGQCDRASAALIQEIGRAS